MDIECWKKITEITDLVLNETSETAQQDIIKSACKNNPALESEVVDFLNSIKKSTGLWDELYQVRDFLTEDLLKKLVKKHDL